MSGTDETFHYTKEDVRKLEARESERHPDGGIAKDSQAATIQSIVDKNDKNKSEIIEERKSNLPLPEQPPVASDFNSSDQRTVNVGSGGVSDTFSKGDDALREPATGDSVARTDGDSYKTNVQGGGVGREGLEGGIPNDAVARGSKDKEGLKDTTGQDYGYPQKNDPADTNKV